MRLLMVILPTLRNFLCMTYVSRKIHNEKLLLPKSWLVLWCIVVLPLGMYLKENKLVNHEMKKKVGSSIHFCVFLVNTTSLQLRPKQKLKGSQTTTINWKTFGLPFFVPLFGYDGHHWSDSPDAGPRPTTTPVVSKKWDTLFKNYLL